MDKTTNSSEQVFDEGAGMGSPQNPDMAAQKASNISSSSDDAWFGIVLIFIGGLFLLNTFDIVPWIVWSQLWKFWPLLLVFSGLKLLLGKSLVSNIITILFVGVVVFFVAVYVVSGYIPQVSDWVSKNFSWLPTIQFE